MTVNKILHWGSLPWEQDGGAVVNYYLLRMLDYLDPNREHFGIPKVPHMLAADELSFMEFMIPQYNKGLAKENRHLYKQIPQYMLANNIPLLVMFHIPWEFFPMATFVRNKIGGKTLIHQTVHWKTDHMFESPCLNEVDSWVVPTRWAGEQLSIVGKVGRKKIKYLPHAVDVEKFYPHDTRFREQLNLKPEQKVILVAGRCSLAKGLHEVIPVMRPIIKDYDAVFIIRAGVHEKVAKSKEISYIIKTMARQTKNIAFMPTWMPPSMMEELMASVDILLQPSGHEGFDVPLIEAMACKVPIAVSNIPNHWEVMGSKNRLCGVFMEPSTVAEVLNSGRQSVKVPSSDIIEGTLRFMLENPDECKAYADQGFARVRRNYNLAKVANDWLDHMDSLFPEDSNLDKRIVDKLREKNNG